MTDDRLAIYDLLNRSSDLINHQEWETLCALFSDDIVWEREPPTPWKLDGRDAVFAFLNRNREALDVLLYTVTASAIDVHDRDRASARSTMSELIRFKKTGAALHVVGTYHDEFAKKNGRWLFSKRKIEPRFEGEVAPPTRVFRGVKAPVSAIVAPTAPAQ